jgi:hypothetical protein
MHLWAAGNAYSQYYRICAVDLLANRAKVQLLIGGKDALRDTHKIVGRLRSLLANVTTTIVPEGGHDLLNTTTYILPFLNKTTLPA